MINWARFEKDIPYRLSVVNELLKSKDGRDLVLDLVRDMYSDFSRLSLTQKIELVRLNYLLKGVEKIEVIPDTLFPQPKTVLGVDWVYGAKWVGIGALCAVASVGVLALAAPGLAGGAFAAAATGLGAAASIAVRGIASAVPALWTWSTANGYRAAGVSIGLLLAGNWGYSKLAGKKSLIEKILDKSGEMIKAAPAAIKTGIILAIALFGAMAIYNITAKQKR